MTLKDSTRAYEDWLRECLAGDLVKKDLDAKHEKMAAGPFPFLRATYWRWAETILELTPDLANAPEVLAVGDIHLENYGTWRDAEGRLIWGVNDFDEAAEMPYPLDLVRLATSAVLGCPGSDPQADICTQILKGYAKGLEEPRAIVLDQDYAWLRAITVVSDDKRAKFWDRITKLPAAEKPAPKPYIAALHAALPDPKITLTVSRRTAGTGSLGRPRWVGVGAWRGALVVREGKAIVPSAWTRSQRVDQQVRRMHDIATGPYRAPDPWYNTAGGIVVRRLSPNNRKIEAESDPAILTGPKMLHAMGHELAAIHLGGSIQADVIKGDLSKRDAGWLNTAVDQAVKFVHSEYTEWKNAWKAK
jgi:hypothetical protein